jgi:hypothetical protein
MMDSLVELFGNQAKNESDLAASQKEGANAAKYNYDIQSNMMSAEAMLAEGDWEGAQERMRIIAAQAEAAGVDITDFVTSINGMNANTTADAIASWNTELLSSVNLIKEMEEETEKWISQYDYLHNLTQLVNQEQRTREKAERDYEKLLSNNEATTGQILDNVSTRLNTLGNELAA